MSSRSRQRPRTAGKLLTQFSARNITAVAWFGRENNAVLSIMQRTHLYNAAL